MKRIYTQTLGRISTIILWRLSLAAVCCALLLSCGLDDYGNDYLDPPDNIIITPTTSQVTIRTSASLRNHTVFYRIYLSNNLVASVTTGNLGTINSALESHYRALEPYTNTDTVPSTIGTILSQRGYYRLCVLDSQIKFLEDILGSTVTGTLLFDFSTSSPVIQIPSFASSLQLRRAAENFTPYPSDRSLTASTNLVDNSNITTNQNLDVQSSSASPASYAYISLYIVATGINDNFSTIYSTPKHLGVFQLRP
jgi:hypothetical protein